MTDGPLPAASELSPVHFIGIGGAGMSGIARIMLARGLVVSGSDAKDSVLLTALRAEGATVHVGHDRAHLAGVEAGFERFAESIRPGGLLVACADDPGSARLAETAAAQGTAVVTYGERVGADVRLTDLRMTSIGCDFAVVDRGRRIGAVALRVPGRHNALNALAAVTAAIALGTPASVALVGVGTFGGTRRRFESRGEAGGVRVFDDYAHNPGKVAAAIATGRQVAGSGRLVAVFQPHLFTRTRDFAAAFGAALGGADEVVVMDVYAAREDPLPGVSGALVAATVPLPPERVAFVASWSAVADAVRARLRPGDVLLTIGAGDVTLLADEVLARLGRGARP